VRERKLPEGVGAGPGPERRPDGEDHLPARSLTSDPESFPLTSIPNEGETCLGPARDAGRRLPAGALVAGAAAGMLLYALRYGNLSADTAGVIQAADWILGGLRRGSWARRGSRFPPPQTIPSLGVRVAGL